MGGCRCEAPSLPPLGNAGGYKAPEGRRQRVYEDEDEEEENDEEEEDLLAFFLYIYTFSIYFYSSFFIYIYKWTQRESCKK